MVATAVRARRRKRLSLVGAALGALGLALALALFALRDNIALFLSPTEWHARAARGEIAPSATLRIGGLVKEGSIERGPDHTIRFVITDTAQDVPVAYRGLVPDLFREGQGVVAEGRIDAGVLHANTILAKHDERYMPREVADALKKQGVWQGSGPSSPARPAPEQ